MKKIIVIICVLFALFLSGCDSLNKEFDEIEQNIKSSIPESTQGNISLITKDSTYNATILWSSSNEEILTSEGVNKNASFEIINVTLTYVITISEKQREGEIIVAVEGNRNLIKLNNVEMAILNEVPEETNIHIKLTKEVPVYNAKIKWSSSDEEILTSEGVNKNKTSDPKYVTLSYVITIDGYTREGQKQVKVLPYLVEQQLNVIEEMIKNSIPKSTVKDIMLIRNVYEYWAEINWNSSNENVISKTGDVRNINEKPVTVTLTYTIKIYEDQRVGTIQVEVPYTENYKFELDYEEIYIGGINQAFSVYGEIYKNNEVFNAYIPPVEIEGEYDPSIPGEYDLTASVEFSFEKMDNSGNIFTETTILKDTFKLIVLSPVEAIFEELNTQKIETVQYSFGFDHYYIVCPVGSLIIYDLNDPKEYKTIEINGRCNSHYYKDGYLYISSVEPYENKYSDDFTGYISKIDLENAIKVEEIKVNSAPDSIVVDKRNNIIISKEQNQHVSIDYLDMNTKEISIMCHGYYGDKLIYNEQDDIVLVVSTYSTLQPNMYKYNEENKLFELVKQFYELEPLVLAPDILERYYNTFIYGSRLYEKVFSELVNGEVHTKEIAIINNRLSYGGTYEVSIGKDKFVIMQYRKDFCYITVYDKETTKYQTYQTITNYNGSELEGIYVYNDNIYVFDKTLGKLLIVK